MAWVLRFVNNVKILKDSRPAERKLQVAEINLAEKCIIKLAQKDSFDGRDDSRLKGFSVYIDESGLIRTKTLISNREDTKNFRLPAILDPKHQFTKLLIRHVHECLKNAGVNTTMPTLRENVWILSSRRAVRSIIGACTTCRRHSAKSLDVPPPSLPTNRVRDTAVFEVVRVDYARPLFLKNGGKAWICLFMCAVYPVIHLELVTSLSTTAFLEALRRFIARRGQPTIIYSDNGTNFVGTYNLFKTVDWKKVDSYCTVERIEWRFNPPSAAWWGGWWERLVRVVKDIL